MPTSCTPAQLHTQGGPEASKSAHSPCLVKMDDDRALQQALNVCRASGNARPGAQAGALSAAARMSQLCQACRWSWPCRPESEQ